MTEEIIRRGGTESSRYFVWGLDLSQSLQGAGGIGGLLAMADAGNTYHYFYDANGNVTQLVNAADGSIAAHYEYDPFGNMTAKSGAYADANPFRFSSKYFDSETGLYYYGYRYYHPEIGRWVQRDPLEETGGLNILAFAINNPINLYDPSGLFFDWIFDNGEEKIEQEKNALNKEAMKEASERINNSEVRNWIRKLIRKALKNPGGNEFEHSAFCYKNKENYSDVCCIYASADALKGVNNAFVNKEPGPCKCKDKSEKYVFWVQMHVHENDSEFVRLSMYDQNAYGSKLGGPKKPSISIAMSGNIAIVTEGKLSDGSIEIFINRFYTDDKGETYE